jgi:Transferrin receptor-like dimerisation domain
LLFRFYFLSKRFTHELQHTLYETHHLLADIMDRGFLHHRAVTQLWAEVARNLLESVVLPLDLDWYAAYLAEEVAKIRSLYGPKLEANNATMNYFQAAVDHFGLAVTDFQNTTLANLDTNEYVLSTETSCHAIITYFSPPPPSVLAVRRVNDQLMQLERHFIDPHGLPNRAEFK